MKLSKKVQRILMASAMTFAVGAGSAWAAPTDTPFGDCTGAAGNDCTAGTAHASVSVTDTLSINEMRAISFGNIATTAPTAGDTLTLGLDGTRTLSGGATMVLLKGANSTGGALAGDPGSQSPGHYTISGGGEDVAVYISFADGTGAGIDMCDDATATVCDDYHPGKSVDLGGGLTVDHFFINQSGSDVYGHYITTTAGGVAPGISDPWLPGGSAHGGGKSSGTQDGEIDVVVGAVLHSDGTAPAVGKHVGTFQIMASY